MSGTAISSIRARQVYTNRGNPGVEAVVTTENGAVGRAMCTSGVSVGTHEVAFAFDGGVKFRGKGVTVAARNVSEMLDPALHGMDAANQAAVDCAMLDIVAKAGCKLGGNATAAVSAAVLKAGAASLGIPLYRHIGGASAMYLPVPGVAMAAGDSRYGGGITTPGGKPTMSVMCFGFDTFADASYACWDVHTRWEERMRLRFGGTPNIRDFIPIPQGVFSCDREIWDEMTKVIVEAGYEGRVGFQMDVATDTYHNKEDDKYYGLFDCNPKTKDELFKFYLNAIKDYPFVIIEDPFNEDDYDATAALTKESGIQIVGDDLFTTNPKRVAYGVSKGAANTVLLKVNQIGTITQALEMIQYAYKFGYAVMPSDSRGEGEAIGDYAVGINAGSIRECGIGPRANRLIEIEQELGKNAKFIGARGLKGLRNQARADEYERMRG
ncbi:MAG: enolase C-terminal domain-like protein [Eubacteriales bacterium]|nr:enolase C-terminal domain-like protein [Eubacteriales bacterium]